MNRYFSAVAAALVVFAGTALCAAPDKQVEDERAKLAKLLGADPKELTPTDIPGIYEFMRGSSIAYVTADGRYFLFGELYERESGRSVTAERIGSVHLKRIDQAVPESEMLVFGPATAKHTLTVFTDIDCGFCRQLHRDVPELNKQGVRVRYVMYPRGGPGSASYKKAEAVWCSRNRKDAFTRAKLGEEIKAKACGATPVKRQYELARELEITGTPSIYTEKGLYISGYKPVPMLLEVISSQ